jgi:biotin carboxyl carrier protein
MASRYPLTIDNVNYIVQLEISDDGVFVTIDDGEPFEIDVTTSGLPGLMSIFHSESNWLGYVVPEPDGWRISHNNKHFLVSSSQSARKSRSNAGSEDPPGKISVPLAGVLIEIRVSAGDVVKSGDTVAVIEAMKMQNEIKTPTNGIITEIHLVAGARAEKGDLILDYEISED